jgi:hypothetical protein
VSRLMPDRPDEDEEFLSRLVREAGDPQVEPRPEHVAGLRALILDRLGPPRAARPWRTRLWAGSGLAAACLLAFFAWRGRDDKIPVPSPPTNESAHRAAPRPPDDVDRIAAWRKYRRVLDGGEMPTFHWPLQGDVAQLGIDLNSPRTARLKERNRPL